VDTGENLGPPLTPLVHTFVGVAGANFGSFLCVIPFGSCNTNNGMHCTSKYLNDINSKFVLRARRETKIFRGRYEGQKVYTIYSKNDDKVGYVTCGRVASALPGQDQAFEV
jgi:triacylglycerol lipase